MTCREFRKYVGAFADGELDTEANAAALEHLNMCPRCAERVAELQQMKAAIRRTFEPEVAPAGLAERVRAAIQSESTTPRSTPRPLHRLFIPLTMAAAVVAAVLVWQSWPVPSGPGNGASVVVPGRFAADIRGQHKSCCDHAGHHDQTLPRNLDVVAKQLSQRLRVRAIAPNLEARGFDFYAAHACDLNGRRCAHVMYRDRLGRTLSVFSVAVADCKEVDFGPMDEHGRTRLFAGPQGDLSLAGWAIPCTAYVLCEKAGQRDVSDIVEYVYNASRPTDSDNSH